jgi:hypothetical protein
VGSGIGKVNVPVTRMSAKAEKSGVEPGGVIVLGYLVKEGETKLERSADVGRPVDYGLPQWCEKSLDTRGGCHQAR